MKPIQTTNPTTAEPLTLYPIMSQDNIDHMIAAGHKAFLTWKLTDISKRSEQLHQVAQHLLAEKMDYAVLMAKEMGKPITAGEAEVEKCAWVCQYYADHAKTFLKPRLIKTDIKKSYVTYQPIGLILAILPWNFPMWQVFRFAAPNLMAGNGCLLKHATITTGTALRIQALFRQAGLPKHLFQTLVIDKQNIPAIIKHTHIAAVTVTGSPATGKQIASLAGSALKKSVLELGGSDPYIILKDADLKKAADACLASRLNNSGQVCIAAKRIIAVKTIYNDIKSLLLKKITHYVMGNPLDRQTTLGPLARKDLRHQVHQQVQATIKAGANLLTGGTIPSGPGFFYPPTLLTEVPTHAPAFTEEIFGPVIALFQAKNEQHAIKLANDTSFGLGAAIFSKNLAHADAIARSDIQTGICAVNTWVRSDPRLPFGGIKASGYGRELGPEGIHSFMNIKTILVHAY